MVYHPKMKQKPEQTEKISLVEEGNLLSDNNVYDSLRL